MADDSNNNNPFIDIVVEAGDGIIRLLEKLGLKEPEAQQIIDTLQQKDLLTGLDVRGVWTENGEIKVAQDTGVTNDQGQPVVRITGPALEALTQAIKNSGATDAPINVDNIAPEAKAVIQAALANDPSNFTDPDLAPEPDTDTSSTPRSPGLAFQDSEKVPQDISTPRSPGNAFQDSEASQWQDPSTPRSPGVAFQDSEVTPQDNSTPLSPGLAFQDSEKVPQDISTPRSPGNAFRDSEANQWQEPNAPYIADVTPRDNSTPLSPGLAFQDSEKVPQDISTPQSPGLAFQDSEASQWQDPSTPRSPGVAFQDSEKVPQDISTPQSPGLAFQDSESNAWQPDTQTLGDKLMDYAKGQNAIRDAGISNDLIDAAREGVANNSWDEPKDYSQYAVPDTGATPPEDPNFSSSEEWNDNNDAVYASEPTAEMQAINDRTYDEQVAAQIPHTLDFGAITAGADQEAVDEARAIVDQTTNQADWDNNGDVIGKTYDLTTHVGQLERARDVAQSTGQRLVQLIDANGQWSGSYADADGNEWMHTDANANGVEDHQEAYYAQQAAQTGEYGVPLANPDGTWTGMGIRPDGSTYVWENSDGDGIEDHAEQAMYEAANLVPVTNSDNQQVYAEGNPVYYYTSDPDMVTPGNEDYSSTVASYTTDTTRPPTPGDAANLGAL